MRYKMPKTSQFKPLQSRATLDVPNDDFYLYGLCRLEGQYFIHKSICPLEISHKRAVNNLAMSAGRHYLLSSTKVEVFIWTIGIKNLLKRLELTKTSPRIFDQFSHLDVSTEIAVGIIDKYQLIPDTQFPVLETEQEPTVDLLRTS